MTANKRRRPKLAALLAGLVGSVAGAQAADLPEDRADAMYHRYDGGGTVADGPALLVRKNIASKVSLTGSYYMDHVSNASIDVVTTASPYKETRHEYGVGLDYAVRDSLLTLAYTHSKEPDYLAEGVSFDVAQEVFGGMTTVNLGFTRALDKVGRKDIAGYFDSAKHWRYRLGATQVLTPRLLGSLNVEAIADDGFLGNPYRSALVFGAAVPERLPRTRSSRAIKGRMIGALDDISSLRAEYRYFWDNWDIKAHTGELGYSRYFGPQWLTEALVRVHRQDKALFYSNNASTETQYITRSRQYSTFDTLSFGARLSYTAWKVPGRYEVKLNGTFERISYDFKDFTDVRTGQLYAYDANVVQLFVSATF
jgi:hypothetical protein